MSKQLLSKEKIVQAGIAAIEADTPLTFANLARTLGTKSQALYPYFKNQTDLAYAIMATVLADLNTQLSQQLFGLSGRDAILQFALTCRKLGLAHPKLALFLATLPSRPVSGDAALQTFRTMLLKLVGELVQAPRLRVLGGRWLRDVIIGEVVNISAGWFDDQEVSREASFRWLIERGLDDLARENAQNEPT